MQKQRKPWPGMVPMLCHRRKQRPNGWNSVGKCSVVSPCSSGWAPFCVSLLTASVWRRSKKHRMTTWVLAGEFSWRWFSSFSIALAGCGFNRGRVYHRLLFVLSRGEKFTHYGILQEHVSSSERVRLACLNPIDSRVPPVRIRSVRGEFLDSRWTLFLASISHSKRRKA